MEEKDDYGSPRSQIDEWAYRAARLIAVAAVGVVCAAVCVAAVSICGVVLWACWGGGCC